MTNATAAQRKRGRKLYILEAALEYLISLLVKDSFLATLTKELGASDQLTGILSSVISLGCVFQLMAIAVRPRSRKRLVIGLSIANQVFFLLLYVIPLWNGDPKWKVAAFAVFIVMAYLLYNFAFPQKIGWLMTLVEEEHRGVFTSNKEIFSLITGMLFTYGMGTLIDHFKALGNMRTAMLLSAAVIFVIGVLHTLTMLFTVEPQWEHPKHMGFFSDLKGLFANPALRRVILVILLYYIGTYVSTPFYGTYQIGELGLSLKTVSLLTICGNIFYMLFARVWGRYADKRSFAVMIEKCFWFMALAQLAAALAFPQWGAVMFVLYYVFHGVAIAGIGSSTINLVYDVTPEEKRADALAVTMTAAGLCGFVATVLVSPFVTFMQQQERQIFGTPVYAQQVLSALAMVISISTAIYVRKGLIKRKKATASCENRDY